MSAHSIAAVMLVVLLACSCTTTGSRSEPEAAKKCPHYSFGQGLLESFRMLGSKAVDVLPRGVSTQEMDHLICTAKECDGMNSMEEMYKDSCGFKLLAATLNSKFGAAMRKKMA